MSLPTSKNEQDAEILGLWDNDPRQAFKLLFASYYEEVCRHIYRYIGERSTVEDIAQEMFSELWTKRKRLDIKSSLGAYLHRMAVSRSLNYIRDNKKHRHSSDENLSRESSTLPGQMDILTARELDQVIQISIQSLPDRCRQVFMLSRFENMTYQQIADAMEISQKTVENQMIKALKQLRRDVSAFQQKEIGGKG